MIHQDLNWDFNLNILKLHVCHIINLAFDSLEDYMYSYYILSLASHLYWGDFVDIFTGKIHSENDYQIQQIICQIKYKDLLVHFVQTN